MGQGDRGEQGPQKQGSTKAHALPPLGLEGVGDCFVLWSGLWAFTRGVKWAEGEALPGTTALHQPGACLGGSRAFRWALRLVHYASCAGSTHPYLHPPAVSMRHVYLRMPCLSF